MLRRCFSSTHRAVRGRPLPSTLTVVLLVLLLCASDSSAQSKKGPTTTPCPNLDFRFLDVGDVILAPQGFDQLFLYDATDKKTLTQIKLTTPNSWTLDRDQRINTALTKNNSNRPDDIKLAWGKSSHTGPPEYCLQEFTVPYPVVNRIFCNGPAKMPCEKGLGDQLSIEVISLDTWIEDIKASKREVSATRNDLVPFLNGNPLPGIHPENPMVQTDHMEKGQPVTVLVFNLTRNEDNKQAWNRLLNGFAWKGRPVGVSLGLEGGVEIPTYVWNDPQVLPEDQPVRHFRLGVLPHAPAIAGFALLAVALVGFCVLMVSTDIVRDSAAPRRPDNKRPFSLARMQMAFWFFLVATAYVLLFLATKDVDTMTTSVLTLMGISAGTALGATIIDAGTTADKFRNVTTERPDNRQASRIELDKTIEDLSQQLAARRAQPATTDEERRAKRAEESSLQENLATARRHRAFFDLPPWRVVMDDLLGDDGEISFHRFQIAVWTLVLGIIFVNQVLSGLAMPEFSGTTLGLMGISSGTYVGFKLSPARETATK